MNSLKKLQQKLKRLEAERNSDGSYANQEQDADKMSPSNSKHSSDEDNNFYSLYPKMGDIKSDQNEV